MENTPLYIDPGQAARNPKGAQGQLTRFQRTDFERRYLPEEKRLLDEVSQDGTVEAKKAGDDTRKAFSVSRGTFLRNLRRQGLSLTPDEQRSRDRTTGIREALSVANAENQTRKNIEGRNVETQAQLVGIGQGVASSASQGLTAAAGLQNQRDIASRQAKDASRAQTVSTVSTLGGIALAAAFL